MAISRKINFINYEKHSGWLRGEIGNYLTTHNISSRELGRISGIPYKTILRFRRDMCDARYETFNNFLAFLESEAKNGRHKFNLTINTPTPLNYQNKIPALRQKLLCIMEAERITPTKVYKETGVAGETIATFCKSKREITFKTFVTLTHYVENKEDKKEKNEC